MRLFVAVQLPPAVRMAVARARAPLERAVDNVRWTDAEALHITLSFIGEVGEAQAGELAEAVAATAARHAPFTIRLGSLGAFPSPGRARIWWVAVEDEGRLLRVQADLAARLAALGVPLEDRPFSPHVTIGRQRGRGGASRARNLGALPAITLDASVPVQSIDLMRSQTGVAGARYTCLAAAPLNGGLT